ncbi:MAG: Group 1 glycosyl transferase [Candidatus Woesebacteria bacterium GW2011_GWA1_41_13b]|uniref:Group 1 glycosyl transferase n=1 Tax=Candidatus Woesebacteria bacterium GW2011_GWA1_41_13b TaxID=1618555 RepID=A0A0G0X451_9BACT|nr:MAG: Group 1 glycosyl transferase [Candidatus Woesebacteria bacterium GW2011_GWA1_41_13b]
MTICYFGIYSSNYTRNKVNIMGLRENGVEVIECRSDESERFKKYLDLFWKYWPLRNKYDVMIVGFHGHAMMPLAWLCAKIISRKKLIWDAFVSTYDTTVFDRKKARLGSVKATKHWLIDWLGCVLADLILLDADAHGKYFIKTFHIRPAKFKTLPVGCDDTIMHPREQNPDGVASRPYGAGKETDNFLVHFHGTYIPAQGIPYIIEAAKLLEDMGVEFNIVGKLETYGKAIEFANELGAKNINFLDFMPYEKLAEYMAMADICLGMFGITDKAMRTGAFKLVEGLAMEKPVITAETPAMKEIFTNEENVLFCRPADGRDLAAKIMELKNNENLRNRIAKNGYKLYKEKLTPRALGADLVNIISHA